MITLLLTKGWSKAMKIKFNDVTYTYQQGTPYEYKALDHINLTIEQGKYYAIVGQTGSGKSTLIDISMGY